MTSRTSPKDFFLRTKAIHPTDNKGLAVTIYINIGINIVIWSCVGFIHATDTNATGLFEQLWTGVYKAVLKGDPKTKFLLLNKDKFSEIEALFKRATIEAAKSAVDEEEKKLPKSNIWNRFKGAGSSTC